MIGLDTNVLVRYLTHDDAAQYARAAAFIEAAVARGEQFLVNSVVLCELVWVLAAAYGYSREEIAAALEQVFATAQFDIERLDDARRALSDFRSTKADFSDALIGRINRSVGAQHTATFDRDLKSLDTFRVL
ncbi:MAG TPA: type II toxin-antitoxin system VapC family toxin [Vicinamibacterales bacterium]|nr:type II toxin-antitoxin system VapC family toxin [Vicinamibacterales bacterium]